MISQLVRFLTVIGRHTYVTPSSYLELLSSFKRLITQKQDSTMKAKKRYLVGLEKLAFASSQVSIMFINILLFKMYTYTFLNDILIKLKFSITSEMTIALQLLRVCATEADYPSHHRSSPTHRTTLGLQPDCLHRLRSTQRCVSVLSNPIYLKTPNTK